MVDGVTSLATIDSGASRSIISETVAEKFQLTINSDISNLNVLGDDNVSVLGTCSALISVGGVELGSIDFAVIKNTPFCQNLFIVGVEFLTDKMEICPKDRKLIKYYSNQSSVEFYFDDSGAVNTKLLQRLPCYSSEDIVIEEGKSHDLAVSWANLDVNNTDLLYFEDDCASNSKSQLMSMPGIFNLQKSKIICFAADSNVSVKKGQQVGCISTMVQLPNESDEQNNVEE